MKFIKEAVKIIIHQDTIDEVKNRIVGANYNTTILNDILITDEIINCIAENESDYCRKVKKTDSLQSAKKLLNGYTEPWNILFRLARLKGLNSVNGIKILEIGSGNGFFLCHAIKNGLDIVGIEPGKTFGFTKRHQTAIKLLEINGVNNPEAYLYDASSECLPFKDNTFDIVFSVAVLEHVQDIDLSIKESIRVLKPDGLFFASVPNYNSTWEEHYDIHWIPYLNKKMAKLYVRLLGRDDSFIDDLNFTNPSMFDKFINCENTRGDIRLYGKSGGIYEMFQIIYHLTDTLSSRDPRMYSGYKKFVIIVLKINIISFVVKKIMRAFMGLFQFVGSVRIIHIYLQKRADV